MKVKAALLYGWMGVNVENGVITFSEIQEMFFRSLQPLTESDCLYLSRTISVCHRSILNWKYSLILPRDAQHIFDVIQWVNSGKPTEKIDDEEFIPWLK